MSVPERKPEPGDLTEAELAPQLSLRRRRLVVLGEVDDDPVFVLVPRAGKREAVHTAEALAEDESVSWAARANTVKSLLRTIWDDGLVANLVEGFAWSRHLPDDDRNHFVDEVGAALKECMATGDLEPYLQLIDEWQSTAEVWADPETLAALTTDPDPTGDPDADPAL